MKQKNKNAYYWLCKLLKLDLPLGFHIYIDSEEVNNNLIETYGTIEDFLEQECNTSDDYCYIELCVRWESFEPRFCYDIVDDEIISWGLGESAPHLKSLSMKLTYEKVKAFIKLANNK